MTLLDKSEHEKLGNKGNVNGIGRSTSKPERSLPKLTAEQGAVSERTSSTLSRLPCPLELFSLMKHEPSYQDPPRYF